MSSKLLLFLALLLPLQDHTLEQPAQTSDASTVSPRYAVFDVKREKVVKSMTLTPELARSVIDSLEDSPTVYGGFTLEPRSGLVVRVPFDPPVAVRSSLYRDRIRQLYLFLEPGLPVRALVFHATSNRIAIVVLKAEVRFFIDRFGLSEFWR